MELKQAIKVLASTLYANPNFTQAVNVVVKAARKQVAVKPITVKKQADKTVPNL